MKPSGPRKYPNAPVTWEEVWHWTEDIAKRWGYYITVTVSPPLPSTKKVRFVVAVNGTKLRVNDPQRDSRVQRWRNVEHNGLTAEVVALQMVVELHQKLDNEEYAAERAALEAGALL